MNSIAEAGRLTSFVVDRAKPSLVAKQHSILGCFESWGSAESNAKY